MVGYWFTLIGSLLAILSAILLFFGFIISPNDNIMSGPNSIRQKFFNNGTVINIRDSSEVAVNVGENQQDNIEKKFKATNPVEVMLTYKLPKLIDDDKCDNEKCIGNYIKIGEDNDSIYFDHPSFKSSRVAGYNYDSGKNGEMLISDWKIEEKRFYDAIKIPKSSILGMLISADSTFITKTLPNYEVME